MLKSMTAFARQDIETPEGTLTWEIRSVNHRYLEPHFKIPDSFRETEPALRESLRRHLARGKVDCSLKFQAATSGKNNLEINPDAASALAEALKGLEQHFDQLQPANALEILAWPGILNSEKGDRKSLLNAAINSFGEALKTLNESRVREGSQLAPLFDARLESISNIVADVRNMLPGILAKQSENIRQRFHDAKVELDEGRLEQEMVLLAQKSDVAEELDRLDAHVTEVRHTLKKKEPVGRRLDFLMQELNREANTLSSKSIVTDTTQAAVELKVLIEQMREQVQNIE